MAVWTGLAAGVIGGRVFVLPNDPHGARLRWDHDWQTAKVDGPHGSCPSTVRRLEGQGRVWLVHRGDRRCYEDNGDESDGDDCARGPEDFTALIGLLDLHCGACTWWRVQAPAGWRSCSVVALTKTGGRPVVEFGSVM